MSNSNILEQPNEIIDQTKADNKSAADNADVKSRAYQKKIIGLKSKIVFGFSIAGFLLVALLSIWFYSRNLSQKNINELNSVDKRIEDLKNESNNIEAKIKDAKKYKQVWAEVDSKKKEFDGIKISDLNEKLKNLADQYEVSAAINISIPEILTGGAYDRQSLEVHLVNCTITLTALTDKAALDFLQSFLDTLPGYKIVSDLSIKKTKKDGYGISDLIEVSNGKSKGLVSGKVSLSWYFLKHKEATQPIER